MKKHTLLCIGHRGAMGHAPENTLSSIRKALELGAPCIEVDVYYVDEHLVVFHDERLERITKAVGYLQEQSFEYLRTLDAGDGQRIPTLQEVCDEIDAKACLNIELKGAHTAGPVVELIASYVDQGWFKDSFLVSSFDHSELLEVKRLDKDIKLGMLMPALPVEDATLADALGPFSVHAALDSVDRRFVDDAHNIGLKVYVYTVNHTEDISKMYLLGVDGVFTNFPERVLANYSQGERTNRWI